jgi:hypothetical protein
LIVDSGKPVVSIRHNQADQGQKLKTESRKQKWKMGNGTSDLWSLTSTFYFQNFCFFVAFSARVFVFAFAPRSGQCFTRLHEFISPSRPRRPRYNAGVVS